MARTTRSSAARSTDSGRSKPRADRRARAGRRGWASVIDERAINARRSRGADRDEVIDHLHAAVAREDAVPSRLVTESAIDRDARVGAILERARLAPPTPCAHEQAILEAALEREDDARAAAVLVGADVGSPELVPLAPEERRRRRRGPAERAPGAIAAQSSRAERWRQPPNRTSQTLLASIRRSPVLHGTWYRRETRHLANRLEGEVLVGNQHPRCQGQPRMPQHVMCDEALGSMSVARPRCALTASRPPTVQQRGRLGSAPPDRPALPPARLRQTSFAKLHAPLRGAAA